MGLPDDLGEAQEQCWKGQQEGKYSQKPQAAQQKIQQLQAPESVWLVEWCNLLVDDVITSVLVTHIQPERQSEVALHPR